MERVAISLPKGQVAEVITQGEIGIEVVPGGPKKKIILKPGDRAIIHPNPNNIREELLVTITQLNPQD